MHTMETSRLKLVLFTDDMFQAIFDDDLERLGKLLDVHTPEAWTEFKDAVDALPVFYEWFKALGDQKWGSYFIVHKEDRELIGTGGYKGGPDENGRVEIGYEIRSAYRNRGLAAEAAGKLVDFAFSRNSITAVLAHTLAPDDASGAVLRKLGFRFSEKTIDPDDGEVCRWILAKNSTHP